MFLHLLPSALQELFHSFAPCFTAPGFRHFAAVLTAWILAPGRHQLTCVLRAARTLGYTAHHSSLYRFLSVGRWSLEGAGAVLVRLLLPRAGSPVLAVVDDTLCHKQGTQIFGVGVHHDAARSSYTRGGGKVTVFGFGHSWVVLALSIPCPWRMGAGWAVPVLFRLYRQKARCPAKHYRKRTELAAEMIARLASLLPPDRRLVVAGDSAYCCHTVLSALPARADFVGPLPMKAALYEIPSGHAPRPGRRRLKGCRIASPETLAKKPCALAPATVGLHGRAVTLDLLTRECLWYPSAGHRPVRIVVTRDPRHRAQTRAFVCTDSGLDAPAILSLYSRRWQLEVTFRDLKQHLGFEDPQNGFWRRPRGERAHRHKPSPRRQHHQEGQAAARTAPLAGFAYALTILAFLRGGNVQRLVACARRCAPWYLHKSLPSFADMRQRLCVRIRRRSILATLLHGRHRQYIRHLWEAEGFAA